MRSKFLCAPKIALDTPTKHWLTADPHSLA